MKYLVAFSLLFVFLLSHSVFAVCNIDGYSIVYVNGINTKSEKDTQNDTQLLMTEFIKNSNLKNTQFIPGYNPSHLAGIGDLAETVSQIFNNPISNYDRDTILLKIHPEVTTQKILFVGHSQGTFYTNELYDYLVNHGVSKEAIGVYNVATPASMVSGYESVPDQGAYVTSSNDKVINLVRSLAPKVNAEPPLPANIDIALTLKEAADPFGGHSFSEVYLANDSVRIVSEIESALKKLSAAEVPNMADVGCFIPPAKDFSYYAQESAFSIADVAVTGVIAASDGIATVGEIAYNGVFTAVAQAVNVTKEVFATITNTVKNNAQIPNQNLLAEVSLDNNTIQSNGQGVIGPNLIAQSVQNNDAAATAINQLSDKSYETNESNVKKAAVEEMDVNLGNISSSTQKQLLNTPAETDNLQKQNIQTCSFQTTKTVTHQNLLINEVAWMGSLKSANDEWIELKNISSAEIDISNWQILDKEEQIKIAFPENTKVSAGGFLLLERTDDNSVPSVKADIIYTGALSNSNEGLRLFDNQCNLVDEVLANSEWPAGDVATKRTMERQADLTWWTYNGAGEGSGDALILGTSKKENTVRVYYGGGGGGGGAATAAVVVETNNNSNVQPSEILISEIQITGGTGKTDNDFIELYNPNDSRINLKGYRLVKRTKTGTTDTSIKSWTDDAYIESKGYYLWANSDYKDISTLPDITTSASLANDNGVALRFGAEDTGTIIDSVAWGAAENSFIGTDVFSQNPGAGQSIQRKIQNNEFIDTDNNADDFELTACPNPKVKSNYCAVSEIDAAANGAIKTNQAPSAFFVFSPAEPKTGEILTFNAASSTDADGNIALYDWDFGDGFLASSTQATSTHAYSLAGNYNIFLIVFDNLNATSTYALPLSVASSSIQENDLNQQDSSMQSGHILISEMMPGAGSGKSDEEFIELYNPTLADISLTGYFLKRKTSVLSTTTQNLVKSADFANITVKANGFLLIASKEYRGSSTPDIFYSNTSYHLAYDDDAVVLYNASSTVIDEVDYVNIESGKSLERKALSNNICVSARGDGEFLGNGCDTNDFSAEGGSASGWEIREVPNPQNQNNSLEPRLKPVINNFSGQYDKTNKKINLSWDGSYDYSGATSTLRYFVSDISVVSSLSSIQTSSTTAEFDIDEVGRDYVFKIVATDKDGLPSDPNTVSVTVPKISLEDINFLLYSQLNFSDGTLNSGQVFTPATDGVLDSAKLMMWAGNGGWSEVYFSVYEWTGGATSTPAQSRGHLLATSASQTISGANYTNEIAWNFSGENNILLEAGKYYYLEAGRGLSSNGIVPTIYWKTSNTNGLYLIINAKKDGGISLQEPINYKFFYDQNINYKVNYLEPFDGKYNSLKIDISDFYSGEAVNSQTISFNSAEQSIGYHEISGNLNINRHGYFKVIVSLSDSIKSESDISVWDVAPPEGKLLNQYYSGDGAGTQSVSQVFRPMASGQLDSITLAVSTSGNGWENTSLSIYEWNGDPNGDANSSIGNILAKSNIVNLPNNYSVSHLSESTWDFSGDNEINLDSSKYYYLSFNVEDHPTDAMPQVWFGATYNSSLIDGKLISSTNDNRDLYLVINKKPGL